MPLSVLRLRDPLWFDESYETEVDRTAGFERDPPESNMRFQLSSRPDYEKFFNIRADPDVDCKVPCSGERLSPPFGTPSDVQKEKQ